jgi:hypothetical protein
MAYSFKPTHTVSSDVHRILERQLIRAERCLETRPGRPDDRVVHEARRHVKKAIALLRLVSPLRHPPAASALDRLARASALLAPVADAQALVQSARALTRGARRQGRPADVRTVRQALNRRKRATDRKAELVRVYAKAIHLLRRERELLPMWSVRRQEFAAVRPGLLRTLTRARRAMARARRHPSNPHFHRLRRRIKDVWLQLRLISRRCGGAIRSECRAFETLDGLLGEHHNLVLLTAVLREEPCMPRAHTAAVIQTIRSRQVRIRRRSLTLAGRTLSESPHDFTRRVGRLWRERLPNDARRAVDATCTGA